MKYLVQPWRMRVIALTCLTLAMASQASAATDNNVVTSSAPASSQPKSKSDDLLALTGSAELFMGILALLMAMALIAVVYVLFCPKDQGDRQARPWRLADALSEEVPFIDATGRSQPMLVASSSRLIAFLGLLVTLTFYIGAGLSVLYGFLTGKASPTNIEAIWKFLAAGAGLFLPYVANQVRAGLESKTGASTAASTDSGAQGADKKTPSPGTGTKPATPTQVPAGPSV